MMKLLDKSRNIQFEAFHVFKVRSLKKYDYCTCQVLVTPNQERLLLIFATLHMHFDIFAQMYLFFNLQSMIFCEA